MTIVSDTTPVLSLIKIDRLDLLEKLFGEILVPEAVFRELTTNSAFSQEAALVQNTAFIKIVSVQNTQSLAILQAVSGLDDGESEAIVLAGERQSDVLIIDERKGRKVAQKLGLTITGTVGILIQAHDEGLLSREDVERCLTLLRKSNIRLSDNLIHEALALLQ